MESLHPGPTAHLQALSRVAEIARRAPLPEALGEMATTVGEALGFGEVTISLVRPAWDDLEVVAVHGSQETRARRIGQTASRAAWRALLDDRHLHRGAHVRRRGVRRDVAAGDRPASGPRFAGRAHDPRAWHPRDALFCTLSDGRDELLGVLSVDAPVSGRCPSDEEIDVLVAVAGQIASAIEQALGRVFARKMRQGTGVLLSVSADLHGGCSTDEVLDAVCRGIRSALSFQCVAAVLASGDGMMRARASVGFEPGTGPLEAAYRQAEIEALLVPERQSEGCVLLDLPTAEQVVPPQIPRAYASKLNGIGPRAWQRHWLVVPLTGADGRLIGFIWADDPGDRLLPARPGLQALRLFADLASGALEASERLDRLRRLAERDPLTGLPNRRALDGFLAGRDGGMALLVCDLDHFKRVNDELGHEAGDEALMRFARILDGLARSSDLAVRLGGEEFALLLPDADSAAAFAVAERLLRTTRERFANLPRGLTVSVGIAAAPEADRAHELLREADRALLVAKRSGRDRAVVHHPETIGALLAELGEPAAGTAEQLGAVLLLAETLDLRDDATARHSRTVGHYAEMAAIALGLPAHRVERLRIAGVLHDVGKVGVADAVLRKPGPLESGEWTEMLRHAELGARILANAGLPDVAAWVVAHHERMDGSGYPAGLSGDQIPLEARVLSVVDAFEAMTADRPYRDAPGRETAVAELERNAGTQFDPDVVAAFLAALRAQEAPATI